MPRPSFKATAEQRKTVKSLAAIGLTQDQIATAIGIHESTEQMSKFRFQVCCFRVEIVS